MTRRWIPVVLTVCLVVTVAVTGIFLMARWPRSRFSRDDFARITLGMALSEVHEILGEPPTDRWGKYEYELLDDNANHVAWATAGQYSMGGLGGNTYWWIDAQGCIGIAFDDQGIVVNKKYYDVKLRAEPTWFERLKARLWR